MAITPTYRSVFSGQEIDEAILAMKNSLDASMIANDYNGGVLRIASAEIAKDLHQQVVQLQDPEYLRGLLLSISGAAQFTIDDQTKLDYARTDYFRGSYLTKATRDSTTLPEILNYNGDEIAFVVDDGTGLSELSVWDTTQNAWRKAYLSRNFDIVPITSAVASDNVVTTFDASKYSTLKVLVTGTSGTSIQSQEILMTVSIDTNNVVQNVYLSVYGEVGNDFGLFNIKSSVNGTVVGLVATTLRPSVKVAAQIIALI